MWDYILEISTEPAEEMITTFCNYWTVGGLSGPQSVPPTHLNFSSAADTHGHLQLNITSKLFLHPLIANFFHSRHFSPKIFLEFLYCGGVFFFFLSWWHCSCHFTEAIFVFSETCSTFFLLSSSLFDWVGGSEPCCYTYTQIQKEVTLEYTPSYEESKNT